MTNEGQEMYQVANIAAGSAIEDQSTDPERLLKAFEKLPEAGGVAWIDLYGTRIIPGEDGKQYRKVFKISLTCRAATPIAALDGLKQAIAHAEKQYKLLPYQ